jgi:hypothetical protein
MPFVHSQLSRRAVCVGLAGAMCCTHHASALERPAGAPVLTIGGLVRMPNVGDRAVFDMAMLERLPQRHLTASTPWYPEPRKFTGPLLRDVLATAQASGKTLRATALNDYAVEIPASDAQQYDVVIARLLDDKPLSVREKGPLFVMYPFNEHPSLRNAVYFGRCVWQLKSIEVS